MPTVLSRKPGGSGGGGAPSGPAGGSLSGTYPNPTIAAGAIDTAELANDSVEAAQIAAGAVGRSELAAGIGVYDRLSDTLLGGDTASFDISGISQSYLHLQLVLQLRANNAVTTQLTLLRFNNDSGANYDYQYNFANGAGAAGAQGLAQTATAIGDNPGSSATANMAAGINVVIPNYTATTFFKNLTSTAATFRGTASGNNFSAVIASQWRSTAAITRITIFPNAGSWLTGSRLTIYGLG